MNAPHRIVVLGAGAAGAAAARHLAPREDVALTLIGITDETPYTRMLIKGIAFGPTQPDLIRLPLPDTKVLADTVEYIDTPARELRTASGARIGFDALVIATGSKPRTLDSDIPGVETARSAGRVSALHSLQDALHIRAAMKGTGRATRIAIYGAGIVAAETASTLQAAGHKVTLIARTSIPGSSAFGRPVAERLAAEHGSRVATHFGRTIQALSTTENSIEMTLDDESTISADFLLIALGTKPAPPAPWQTGPEVDERLRTKEPLIYAAGGVATHHDDHLGTWRIDHWEDAANQGIHAAKAALYDLGLAEDPGAYRPRGAYMAIIYGLMISGAGFTGHPETTIIDECEFIVHHELNNQIVGVSGIDAVGSVYQWAQQLHCTRA